MTDCTTQRDWILEADPEALKLNASGEHGDHLAKCPECRALVDEILGAQAALRETLDSVAPALDVEAALVRAREARRATQRRTRWQVALPLAAATLGGVLLMNRPSPVPVSGFDPATVRAAAALGLAGAGPLVRAESHQRVAVLPTENPNITVIWFME
jgi:anti-sigma factor RsiW